MPHCLRVNLALVLNLTQVFNVNFGVKALKVSGTEYSERAGLLRKCTA